MHPSEDKHNERIFWSTVPSRVPGLCWPRANSASRVRLRVEGAPTRYGLAQAAYIMGGGELLPKFTRYTRTCGNTKCCNPAHIRPVRIALPIAETAAGGYNHRQKTKSFLAKAEREESPLNNLIAGKPTFLEVRTRYQKPGARFTGSEVEKLQTLALIPGSAIGQNPAHVLASLIDRGSCIVSIRRADNARSVAKLVRMGLPHRLCVSLINEIYRVFKE